MNLDTRLGAVFFSVLPLFALIGCQEVGTTAGVGVATVESGTESIRQGAGQLGNIATLGVFEKLGFDKQKKSLLREVRELNAHLNRLERHIREKRVRLALKDSEALRRVEQDLAAAGQRLRKSEFSRDAAREIYRGLDAARGTFNLISQRYGAPQYTGHISRTMPN